MRPKRCLLIAALSLALGHWLPARAQDPLMEGRRLIAQKQYREALRVLDAAKQAAPNEPEAYFLSGLALAGAGYPQQAARELKRAVEIAPGQLSYRVAYATALTQFGQKDSAMQTLSVLEGEDNLSRLSAEELWQVSNVFFQLDESGRALRALKRLTEIEPANSQAWLLTARARYKNSDFESALAGYRRFLEENPDDPRGYHGLGQVWFRENRLEKAKDAFLKAVNLAPAHPEYRAQLGRVCLAKGEIREAIGHLERAADPAYPRIYHTLARAYRAGGEKDRAAHYLRLFREHSLQQKQAEQQVRESMLLVMEGQERLRAGDAAGARKSFEEALKYDPDNSPALTFLAKIYISSAYWSRAHEMVSRMLKVNPASFEALYLAGEYWYARNEPDEALAHATRAKEIRPGDGELRNLLGNILLALGEGEKALAEYAAAVRLEPDRQDFRLNLESLARRLRP